MNKHYTSSNIRTMSSNTDNMVDKKPMGAGRNSSNRISQIDIAKGICIFLMVLGHSSIPRFADDFIHAFHMPFFFFISGVTTNFNTEKWQFAKKKTLFLLLPFIVYGLLISPVYSYV